MDITQITGIQLARGELVEIDGIVCKKPLNKKKMWITLFNCSIREIGKKFRIVYLVVLTQFEAKR
jgi:hypothetical protein